MKKILFPLLVIIIVLSFSSVFAAAPTISKNYLTDIYAAGYTQHEFRSIKIQNTVPSGGSNVALNPAQEVVKAVVNIKYDPETDDSFYELVLGGNGGISTPVDSEYLFGYDMSNPVTTANKSIMSTVKSITGWENIKTGNTTSMRSMFEGCSFLENIDVSGFDTSKV